MTTPQPPTATPPAVPPTPEEAAQQHAAVAQATFRAATINALITETAKLQLKLDWSDLPPHQRFENPSSIFQFLMLHTALKDRCRNKIWTSDVETWVCQQMSSVVYAKYKTLLQTRTRVQYVTSLGLPVHDVYFTTSEQWMTATYQHFFGSSLILNKILDLVKDFRIGSQGQFDTVTGLTTCALQAFSIIDENVLTVPVRVALIINVMPKYAKEKLHDWYDGQMDNMTVEQLCRFAERVDNSFEMRNKNMKNAESLNDIKDHHRFVTKNLLSVKTKRVMFVTPPVSPNTRKLVKSILKKRPWTPRYPRSPESSKAIKSYKDQNHYVGQCAKCGKIRHSIAKCFKATEKEKQDFFNKVKANKAKYNKPVKKVRFSDNKTLDENKSKTD